MKSECEQAFSPDVTISGILESTTHEAEAVQYDERTLSTPLLDQSHEGLFSEEEIDHEFGDAFVTQIYNYLSLGFPCIARFYDPELSKVSGISLEELRQNDLHTDPRGYILLTEDSAAAGPVTRGVCKRWIALRLYIRDWARHQSNNYMGNGHPESWGVCERKGSWAD